MNSISRYYIAPVQWQGQRVTLQGDEAHHCVRVLRSKLGDVIELFDGVGRYAQATIVQQSKSVVEVEVAEELRQARPACPITLYQAIPKGSNMEWIVQKAVELGVSRIQPLVTENTVVKPDQLKKKQEKWQRTALEACKQCGQNWLPEVLPVTKFSEWMDGFSAEDDEVNVVAALDPRSKPINDVIGGKTGSAASILIGPEGDFSQAEYDAAIEAGFLPASIGDIVLKVETATMFCLSALQYELRK